MAAERDPVQAKDNAVKYLKEAFKDDEDVDKLIQDIKDRGDIISESIATNSHPQPQDLNILSSMVANLTKVVAITRSSSSGQKVTPKKIRIPESKGAQNLKMFQDRTTCGASEIFAKF